MRNPFYNMGYYLKEVITIFRMNLLSNIFSLLSTGLIFFMLALVVSGSVVSNQVVELLQGEAEISVYLQESLEETTSLHTVSQIENIEGVLSARVVNEEEAYQRMEDMLGKEARVLTYFDENPFTSFIELQIDLSKLEQISTDLGRMDGIDYIRDNKEVLEKIDGISQALKLLSYLVVAAVGITALVILSHIIRQGIYHCRDQIQTLDLLGAPQSFIAFPFILEGFLHTVLGGALAFTLFSYVLKLAYSQISGPLPFIPLPPIEALMQMIGILLLSASAILGILGSLFGLASSK